MTINTGTVDKAVLVVYFTSFETIQLRPMRRNTNSDKRFQRSLVKRITRSVIEIKPLIHLSQFSGHYDYKHIKCRLGKLGFDKAFAKRANKKNYTYKRQVHRSFSDGKIAFLFQTYAPYNSSLLGHLKPQCIVETSNSSSKLLSRINHVLPGLNIMSLEYAIDLYCPNNNVANLLYMLRRYTYIHHAKQASMINDEYLGYEDDEVTRDINAVSQIRFKEKTVGNKRSSGKYVKIYERGDDALKKRLPNRKKGWLHKDTNRVRLEVTIHRKNGALEKNGIKTLNDLVQGPKFQEIIFPKSSSSTQTRKQDQIQFKNFIDRKNGKLPKEYEDYLTEDAQGNMESFMNEYFRAKKLIGRRVSQEMENSKNMEPLKTRMVKAAKLFDKNW